MFKRLIVRVLIVVVATFITSHIAGGLAFIIGIGGAYWIFLGVLD